MQIKNIIFYYKNYPQEWKQLIKASDKLKKDLRLVSADVDSETLKVFGIKKIRKYKTYNDFIKNLKDFIQKKNEDIEKLKGRIKKLNADIVYDKDGIIVAEIKDYKSSKALGSKSWCIVTDISSWEQYVDDLYNGEEDEEEEDDEDLTLRDIGRYENGNENIKRKQYFIWNFNLSTTDNQSMIGVTVRFDSSIRACHLKDDTDYVDEFQDLINNFDIPRNVFKGMNEEDAIALIEKGDIENVMCSGFSELIKKYFIDNKIETVKGSYLKTTVEHNDTELIKFFVDIDDRVFNSINIKVLTDLFRIAYSKGNLEICKLFMEHTSLKFKKIIHSDIPKKFNIEFFESFVNMYPTLLYPLLNIAIEYINIDVVFYAFKHHEIRLDKLNTIGNGLSILLPLFEDGTIKESSDIILNNIGIETVEEIKLLKYAEDKEEIVINQIHEYDDASNTQLLKNIIFMPTEINFEKPYRMIKYIGFRLINIIFWESNHVYREKIIKFFKLPKDYVEKNIDFIVDFIEEDDVNVFSSFAIDFQIKEFGNLFRKLYDDEYYNEISILCKDLEIKNITGLTDKESKFIISNHKKHTQRKSPGLEITGTTTVTNIIRYLKDRNDHGYNIIKDLPQLSQRALVKRLAVIFKVDEKFVEDYIENETIEWMIDQLESIEDYIDSWKVSYWFGKNTD